MLFRVYTKRLLLTPISMECKLDIFREFTKELTTYLYAESDTKIEYTENFINQSLLNMQKAEELIIVILKKDSQEFLGSSSIHQINTQYPQIAS